VTPIIQTSSISRKMGLTAMKLTIMTHPWHPPDHAISPSSSTSSVPLTISLE
jgi:hypothetical protein